MFIKYVLKTCIHNDFDAGSNWAIPAHRGSSSQQDGHTVTELATHTTLQPANQKRPAPASPQPLASHSQGAGIGRVQGLRCNFLGLMILVSIAVQASRREAGAAGDETRTTSTKTLHLHFVHKRGIGVKRLVKECTAQLGARLAGSRTSTESTTPSTALGTRRSTAPAPTRNGSLHLNRPCGRREATTSRLFHGKGNSEQIGFKTLALTKLLIAISALEGPYYYKGLSPLQPSSAKDYQFTRSRRMAKTRFVVTLPPPGKGTPPIQPFRPNAWVQRVLTLGPCNRKSSN